MSLINDALRKAQRERSGSAQPLPPTAPSAPGAGYRPATKPATNLWPIAIAAVALVGGGAAVWFLKPAAPAPVTVAASLQPATPAVTTTPTQDTPPAAASTTDAGSPTAAPDGLQLRINLPGTSAPSTAPVPALPQPQPAPVAAPATPEPAPTNAPAVPFQITLQLEDPRILAFLDNARISGIRIAADDAKLLMNSKVYRAGDVVDRELGLKVAIIRPAELVFEDKRGIQYRKVL